MTAPTVLIVEDDPIVRDYAVLVFTDDVGCPTLAVANADQAIQALDRHPEITTAFIDVLLAGNMNGIALAAALNISYPHIRIILTSGARPAGIDGFDFIAKPWDVDQLRRLVGLSPGDPAATRPGGVQRAMILLAEDDALFCAATRVLLEQAGHHVRTAANGAEAIAKFAASPPDLLVTDLEMPVRDGAELVRTLQKRRPDLPILLLTASTTGAELVMAEHPGARIRFVPKLAAGQRLLPMIAELLAEHSRAPVASA